MSSDIPYDTHINSITKERQNANAYLPSQPSGLLEQTWKGIDNMYKSGYYFVQLNKHLPAIPMYVVNINDDMYIYQSAVGKWKQVMEWEIKSTALTVWQ